MRCNKCGASSRVLYTSDLKEQFLVKRRRECDNLHRFVSYEIHSSVFLALGKKRFAETLTAYLNEVRRYARDLAIWKARVLNKETYTEIARRLDSPESSIRRIVHAMQRQRSHKAPQKEGEDAAR